MLKILFKILPRHRNLNPSFPAKKEVLNTAILARISVDLSKTNCLGPDISADKSRQRISPISRRLTLAAIIPASTIASTQIPSHDQHAFANLMMPILKQ
jgi:hypothetical protein